MAPAAVSQRESAGGRRRTRHAYTHLHISYATRHSEAHVDIPRCQCRGESLAHPPLPCAEHVGQVVVPECQYGIVAHCRVGGRRVGHRHVQWRFARDADKIVIRFVVGMRLVHPAHHALVKCPRACTLAEEQHLVVGVEDAVAVTVHNFAAHLSQVACGCLTVLYWQHGAAAAIHRYTVHSHAAQTRHLSRPDAVQALFLHRKLPPPACAQHRRHLPVHGRPLAAGHQQEHIY